MISVSLEHSVAAFATAVSGQHVHKAARTSLFLPYGPEVRRNTCPDNPALKNTAKARWILQTNAGNVTAHPDTHLTILPPQVPLDVGHARGTRHSCDLHVALGDGPALLPVGVTWWHFGGWLRLVRVQLGFRVGLSFGHRELCLCWKGDCIL